jgi:hypothetical protein
MQIITNKNTALFLLLISTLFSIDLYAQNKTTIPTDSLVLAQNLKQISLKNKPSSFAASYTFDPKLNLYFYNVKVGRIDTQKTLSTYPQRIPKKGICRKV